jgi:hypothetical protein
MNQAETNRNPTTRRVGSSRRWLLPGLIVLAIFVVGASLLATWISWRTDPEEPVFERPLAEVNLDAGPFDNVELAQLTLPEEQELVLRYTLADISTPLLDLSLVAPDGTRIPIQHSEPYRTDADGGGEWRQPLPAGDYSLVLTAEVGQGVVTIYTETP